MKKLPASILLVSALCLTQTWAFAAGLTGEEIMKKVDANYQYQSNTSKVMMTIAKSDSQKRQREFDLFKKKENAQKSKTLIKFTAPANIAGSGLLIYKEQNLSDRQWLYLSADKIVKDIVGSEKQKSFMGSDFTHEDIAGHSIDAFKYQLIKEAVVSDKPCYVVESLPKNQLETAYSKLVNYVSKDTFYPVQVDFYDGKGALVKTLLNQDIVKEGAYYYAKQMTMKNLEQNTYTLLSIAKISLDQPLSDYLLTQQGLKK